MLYDHHARWIVDAAQTHFAERVEEIQTSTMRLERFGTTCFNSLGRPYTEEEVQKELGRNQQRMEEYKELLDYLTAVKQRQNDVALEEGFDAMMAVFGHPQVVNEFLAGKKEKPTGKKAK